MTIEELVERIPVAMMTTIDRGQQLTSRPMLAVETAGQVVWFLTRADTNKLTEISADARVNLAFVGSSGEYASVSGRATVSDDRHMVERLWNPTYRAWFPEGREDPDIVLLRISVERADYWETSSSRVQRLFGVVKAMVTGEPYEIEKESIDLPPPNDPGE
jgi:general stress protein 26